MYKRPQAVAYIAGSEQYKSIRGIAEFFSVRGGVLVYTEVYGLPHSTACPSIFAYHIHEGGKCQGNQEDAFADALAHYNPSGLPHPCHAGDLPPLLGNYGFAWSAVFTSRFDIEEIMGRTVIVHSHPDDFKTQPSGDSGSKIACGVIERF